MRKSTKVIVAGTAFVGVSSFVGLMGGYEAVEADSLATAERFEEDYVRKFGCSVTNTVFEVDHGGEIIDRDDDMPMAVTADRGHVVFPPELIRGYFFKHIDQSGLHELTAHEMVHACAGQEKPLPEEFVTEDGRFIATQGFKVLVELYDRPDDRLAFLYIEEGVATALSEQTHNDEAFETSPQYQAVRDFTVDLQNRHGISNAELAGMMNNSDLLGFVARVKGLESAEDVTVEHLGGLMWEYCTAYASVQEEHFPEDPTIDC